MLLLILIGSALIQVCSYIAIDRTEHNWAKTLVLLVLITLNIYVFPGLFYPTVTNDGHGVCGMPFMAVNILFWFIANGLVLFTHIAYIGLKHIRNSRKSQHK